MSIYFSKFPKTYYGYNTTYKTYVTNIASRIAFEQKFKENVAAYYTYKIKDDETPEVLAYKIYGNPERHWIILLMNDIIDPLYDWPLDYFSFNKYIATKYGSVESAMANTHSYYKVVTSTINANTNSKIINTEKIQVDEITYTNILENPNDYTYEVVTLADGNSLTIEISTDYINFYDYENELNENKRNIKLLKQEFVSSAVEQLNQIFQS